MANLGFVGLGLMGSEMAIRLLEKCHTVTGYNRMREKAQRLIERGINGPTLLEQLTGPVGTTVILGNTVCVDATYKLIRMKGGLNHQNCDLRRHCSPHMAVAIPMINPSRKPK
jgi:NAD binding domain of 6-phosphogluconate dehydrogenase